MLIFVPIYPIILPVTPENNGVIVLAVVAVAVFALLMIVSDPDDGIKMQTSLLEKMASRGRGR